MNVGFVGLGKLGAPIALALEKYGGHKLFGVESDTAICNSFKHKYWVHKEEGVDELIKTTKMVICDMEEMIDKCDVVFCAVQTPHVRAYEGDMPLPHDRVDFDYDYLKDAVEKIADEAALADKRVNLIIISTCLPCTMDDEILPILKERGDFCNLIYNPFFIAMGTAIQDFLHPEFVLVGQAGSIKRLQEVYKPIYDDTVEYMVMSLKEAELTKVFYNTYITTKITLANTAMEICHKLHMNVDNVQRALKKGSLRLTSSRYMDGGMQDGGACHPRDLIAMSYLGQKVGLSYNIYEELAIAREAQVGWLSGLIYEQYKAGMKIYILGKSFKPESNIVTGSPAILLSHLLKADYLPHVHYDPEIDEEVPTFESGIYFIGTQHECFKEFKFPKGSVVLDPFRYLEEQEDVTLIRIGGQTDD